MLCFRVKFAKPVVPQVAGCYECASGRVRACGGSEDVVTINRKLGSVVVAGGLAVGLAGPALADPPAPQMFDGTYTYSGPAIANGPNITTQWIATSCGVGCANVAVAPAAGQAGFSAQAQLGYGGGH